MDNKPPASIKREIELQRAQDYDSRADTHEHISRVREMLGAVICEFVLRCDEHDKSKLINPEKAIFDEFTPKLKGSTYGSDEYRGFLDAMKPALDHHYANNRHHPEHFDNGVHGMTLLDLIEMLVDWKAATMRHDDGDIRRSLEINQKRFGYSDELKGILSNTVDWIEERFF